MAPAYFSPPVSGRTLDQVRKPLGLESITTIQIHTDTSRQRVAAAAASLLDVVGLAGC